MKNNLKLGIVGNVYKKEITKIINTFLELLVANKIEFLLSDNLKDKQNELVGNYSSGDFCSIKELAENTDLVVSFGGDGTMLSSAYELRGSQTPMLGINLGKLGFLAEYDLDSVAELVKEIKEQKFVIDERMALSGFNVADRSEELYGINDIVIEKGKWPKMIELTIKVDNDYVSTFSADGLIIATPTGSTGYSLSTGGPIVNPKLKAITLCPISPHTLTMRPLVLSSKQKIEVEVRSSVEKVQVNCDGQRVYYYDAPVTLEIGKSDKPIRLVHSNRTNYFEILRNKLYWGLDLRKNNMK